MDAFFQGLVERSQKIKIGMDHEIIKVDVQSSTKYDTEFDTDDPPLLSSGTQKSTRFQIKAGNESNPRVQGTGALNSRGTTYPAQPSYTSNRPGALTPINETLSNTGDRASKVHLSSPRLSSQLAASPRSNHSYRSPAKAAMLSPIKNSFTNSGKDLLEDESRQFSFRNTSPRKITHNPFKLSQTSPEKPNPRGSNTSASSGIAASASGIGNAQLPFSSSSSSFRSDHLDHSNNYHDFDIVKRKSFRNGLSSYVGSWAPISAGAHFIIPKRVKKTTM